MNKQDYLRECMSSFGIVPHDEFKKAFCLRCLRQECTWSVGATTHFANRVANWKEKLFEKVDRADENDPKYASVRDKQFLPVVPNLGNISTGPSFISPNMQVDNGIVPAMFVTSETLEEEKSPDTEPMPSEEEPLELIRPEEEIPTVINNEEPTVTENEIPEIEDLSFEGVTAPEDNMTPDVDNLQEPVQQKELAFGMTQNTDFQQGVMLEGHEAGKQENVIPAGGTVILDDE